MTPPSNEPRNAHDETNSELAARHPADPPLPQERPAGPEKPIGLGGSPSDSSATSPVPAKPRRGLRKWIVLAAILAAVAIVAYLTVPWLTTALNTISTDDAYVNGHVTFVAPRVSGQVLEVLVDDNYRVKKGQLLVRLDPEPFQIQVSIKKTALESAQTDLVAAQAQVRADIAVARANRYKLEHAMEDVKNQIANLRAAVASLNSKKASLKLAESNYKRAQNLRPSGGVSQEEVDVRRETVTVAESAVDQAREAVLAIRAGLGLPAEPPSGHDLSDVPPDLDQTFSTVRQALGQLLESAAQFGYFPSSWTATPREVIEDFYKQDPEGNLNRILARLIPQAPAIKQAEAKVAQAKSALDDAELNLRYCNIYSEIDGVVTGRNVNPGNNVLVGQSLMAVRSLTEIWIDANFKETQLAYLRIGQRVRVEADMYGRRQEFQGRISGFTMGTGQTLALLPPQNATGNFVKIVQRLPVRIELTDYDPERLPLFDGLSVVPYVYYKEPPTGQYAGEYLQQIAPMAQRTSTTPTMK